MQESVFEVRVPVTGNTEKILCIGNYTPVRGLWMGLQPRVTSIIPPPGSMTQVTGVSLGSAVSSPLHPYAQVGGAH